MSNKDYRKQLTHKARAEQIDAAHTKSRSVATRRIRMLEVIEQTAHLLHLQ